MRSLACIALVSLYGAAASAQPSELETARTVDEQLARHFADNGVAPTGLVSDEDFLRRVSLDLAGVLPAPHEVTLFGLNPEADKRSHRIDALLDSQDYARNWGSYWKDVVMTRATEQRIRLSQPAFHRWLTDQFANNRPWDEMTRDLLTATGSVSEEGATGLIFAHTGQPQELAAEVSRIFLGIQMSCADCHDHPTDAWTREQFHQFAAFFPRLSVRPETPGEIRTFAVTSADFLERQQSRRRQVSPEQYFRVMDRNRDGKLAKSEARGQLAERFDQVLAVADKNSDGFLSPTEAAQARAQQQNNPQPGRGSAEYYMPDLDDPAAQGTLMQPAFFIPGVPAPRLQFGSDDLVRRSVLADYVTSPQNPWFARAFVNRIWSEMLGQGFFMPIDDMGPERSAVFTDVLDTLANGFVRSGYDVKWLFRTIANTQAYQRQLSPAESAAADVPFAAAVPTRLRSDQIYNAITQVLGTPGIGNMAGGRRRGMLGERGDRLDPAQVAFGQLFGFDPSTPQADLLGNVPQALFMMNSAQIANLTRGTGYTRLGTILREFADDRDALQELYLLVFCRVPSARELEITREFIQETGNRATAYEDVMWSLMNSTEFLSKR